MLKPTLTAGGVLRYNKLRKLMFRHEYQRQIMLINEVHISSLVVHVAPENLLATRRQIDSLDSTEVYGDSPEGKIIVVLETENQGFVTETIDVINNIPNVLNVALVYHQIDKEPHEISEINDVQYSDSEGRS